MSKWFVVVGICLVVLSVSFAEESPKSVLIIDSYHPSLKWTEQCQKGIKSVLGENYQIDAFFMDTKRIPAAEFRKQAEAAWREYLRLKPDLVMIGDDNALRLLGPKLAKTDTPVVYYGINANPRMYFDSQPANITGVLERLLVFPWIRYLKQVMPDANRALVLMDDSQTSEAIFESTFYGRGNESVAGVEVDCLIVHSWQKWKNLVKKAGKLYDFIIMPTFHAVKCDNDKYIEIAEVVEWTSKNSSIPVFSHQDYTVFDKGLVGAYVVWGETHGELAAEMAKKILEDKKTPRGISPKMDRKGKFFFNKRQLKRFKLNLPEQIKRDATFK